MKKILFGLLATVLLTLGAQAQKVGEIKEGKLVITEDLSFLKERWNKVIQENKLPGTIQRFEVTSDSYVDGKENVTYYQITGYTKDESVKVATELKLGGENKLTLEIAEISHSVTCSGCIYGCHPRKYNKIGWACEPSCSGGECTKSETVTY